MVTNVNVVSETPDVKSSAAFQEFLGWLHQKAESGELPGPTVSNCAGAIKQLSSVLRADEPDDVEFAVKNIDELARRWVNKNPGNKAETARTYIGRFKMAAEWYQGWKADPIKFRFPAVAARPKREPKAERREANGNVEVPVVTPPANEAASTTGYKKYPIPLGGGRPDLQLLIPEGEQLTVNDCFRVLWATVLHAKDFDPRNPQVMAIQRHQGDA